MIVSAPAERISAIGPDPRNDAIVSIRPDDGDGEITLRIPEIVYSRALRETFYIDHVAGGGFVALREGYVHVAPDWETVEPGRRLRYRFATARCEMRAELVAGADDVRLEWAFRNLTGVPILDLAVQFCPCIDRFPAFADPAGERVYLPVGDDFVRSIDRSARQRVPVLHARPENPADDVICLESSNGRSVIGIGWDARPSHFLNNSFLSCVHAEPALGTLDPGAERVVRGTLYCMAGDRRDLVARFRKEWREYA